MRDAGVFRALDAAGVVVLRPQCARFLRSGRLAEALYTAAFLAVAFLGCLFPLTAVWRFADGFNLLLALPCLAMLFLYRREVVRGGPAKKRK